MSTDRALYSGTSGRALYNGTSGRALYSGVTQPSAYKFWLNQYQGRSRLRGYLYIANDDDENGDPVAGTRSQVYPAVRDEPLSEVAGTSGLAYWTGFSDAAEAYYSIYTYRYELYKHNRDAGELITAIQIKTNATYHTRPSGAGRLMVSARTSDSSDFGTRSDREGGTTKYLGSSYDDDWVVSLDAYKTYLFISVFVEAGEPPTASGVNAVSSIFLPSYVMITPA